MYPPNRRHLIQSICIINPFACPISCAYSTWSFWHAWIYHECKCLVFLWKYGMIMILLVLNRLCILWADLKNVRATVAAMVCFLFCVFVWNSTRSVHLNITKKRNFRCTRPSMPIVGTQTVCMYNSKQKNRISFINYSLDVSDHGIVSPLNTMCLHYSK